ncbi:hypothetical protein MMC22_004401 [Lobaria immixta]|nr:hypothetical protein [Lobaria immixta]
MDKRTLQHREYQPKVATRNKISIYANTRPGRAVKGNLQVSPEAVSKWARGGIRGLSRKGKKQAEEDLKPVEATKQRRISEIPQLSSQSDTDSTSDNETEAKAAPLLFADTEHLTRPALTALNLKQRESSVLWEREIKAMGRTEVSAPRAQI